MLNRYCLDMLATYIYIYIIMKRIFISWYYLILSKISITILDYIKYIINYQDGIGVGIEVEVLGGDGGGLIDEYGCES